MDGRILPLVTVEVFSNVDVEIERKGSGQYAKEIFARIETTNPVLAFYINMMTMHRDDEGHPDKQRDQWSFRTVCVAYRLIESQGEADQLKQELH